MVISLPVRGNDGYIKKKYGYIKEKFGYIKEEYGYIKEKWSVSVEPTDHYV